MKKKFGIDQLGICTSALCIIHCIAMPFLLILGLDTLLWWTEVDFIEITLIGLSLFIGSVSFINGYRRHKQHFIPVLSMAGLLLMINGESVGQEWLGVSLSVVGAVIVIYAHFNNYQLQKYVA